jgi:plastocyanin
MISMRTRTPRRRARLAPQLIAAWACTLTAAEAGNLDVHVTDGSGQAVPDAVVIFDPLEAPPPAGHALSASIDQVNKRFKPRVNVVRTGTSVSFPNSDDIRHQLYSYSPPHRFKLKLYSGTPSRPELFDKPGLVVLGCNIHDTMVGYVVVVDTPFFAKTAPSGAAALTLPAGSYRVRVWHEKLAGPFESPGISVGAGASSLPLTIALDPARQGTPELAEGSN